ncbi:hypothetical protein NC653_037162 [Populus alba x Populus x berolinensis]|uniref:Uncharacterized protein n=1 Tax=Populus alba x Populus x berolinensis TaxID=444605 RepID=A0AAD6LDY5_9ROSI|nr:hypothetical protein NC653_037162 [Populus alba x Populus x berolinensis]
MERSLETPVETTDLEMAYRKSTSQDLLNVSQHKLQKKRMVFQSSATKVEVSEGEKSCLAKSFQCSSRVVPRRNSLINMLMELQIILINLQLPNVRPVSSDIDTGSRSTGLRFARSLVKPCIFPECQLSEMLRTEDWLGIEEEKRWDWDEEERQKAKKKRRVDEKMEMKLKKHELKFSDDYLDGLQGR